MLSKKLLAGLAAGIHGSSQASAETVISSADAQTTAIVEAANAFLATLSDAQRKAVVFDFTDAAQRVNWSNFPLGGPGAKVADALLKSLDANADQRIGVAKARAYAQQMLAQSTLTLDGMAAVDLVSAVG